MTAPVLTSARGISRRRVIGTALAALVAGATPSAAQRGPLRVVTTTAMLADAARAVGGDRVRVESLLGEGVDPHTYRPTRADMARLSGADLVIANGLHLEAQMEGPLRTLGRTRPVVFAGEAVPAADRLADPDYADRHDPHVWMDPKLWTHVVGAIRDALVARDGASRARFEAAAATYSGRLAALDDYVRRALGSIAAERRILVTAHDAFGYLGRAYGLEVEGVQGLSTESEAGLRRIEELVTLLVTRRIPAVFVETSVADRNIRALIEGAAARGHRVALGGELYSDAMGAPGTYEGTLIGMLDHNATVIARALGGEAPPRGMSGALAARRG